MRDRVKQIRPWIGPGIGATGLLLAAIFMVYAVWDPGPENAAVPTLPAPTVEAFDLSTPDREYDGRPVYEPDFYFVGDLGHYYPAWVVEVEGKIYLVMYENVRAYPLEGESWPQEQR